jgi:hypothetical protein
VNRVVSHLITVVVTVAFTLLGQVDLRGPGTPAVNPIQLTDAAFQDGSYLAKLDVESGRRPHLSVGRWSRDEDRASYIAGYQQTYQQLSAVRGQTSPE